MSRCKEEEYTQRKTKFIEDLKTLTSDIKLYEDKNNLIKAFTTMNISEDRWKNVFEDPLRFINLPLTKKKNVVLKYNVSQGKK